MSWKTNIALIN